MGIKPIFDTTIETNVHFFSTILTDSKGERSYLYILKLYETIKNMKIPVAICFASKKNDTDAFKTLLNEAYLIISSDLPFEAKKIELLNYFMFIHTVACPPSHTLLSLKLHYMSVDFYFNSKCEIPSNTNDTNINILFSVLDVSKIIKLWINVLRERQILIYGNKPFLLYAIVDAITKIIFPFKWPHTIIPCLPNNKLYLLENPCPYIYGVLSTYISINELTTKYSDRCIVDLETGHIIAKSVGRLPRDEEISVKKLIQFVKNPELFEENELFKSEKEMINSKENINQNLTFSSNIQRIFFNLIKGKLMFYKDYVINNKIDEKRFMNCFNDQEKAAFWQKMIKTQLGDLFIFNSSDNNREDSYKQIFNELCLPQNKTQPRTIHNSLKVELSCPYINKNNIIKLFQEMKIDNYEDFEKALTIYKNEICKPEEKNQEICHFKSSTSVKRFRAKSNGSSDFSMGKDDSYYVSTQNKECSFKLIFQETNDNNLSPNVSANNGQPPINSHGNNIDLSSSPLINSLKESNYINSLPTKNTEFLFYDEKEGFIQFMNKYIEKLENKKFKLIDIIIRKDFLTEIYEQSNKLIESLPLSNPIVKEEIEPEEQESKSLPIKMKLAYIYSPQMKHKNTISSSNSLNKLEESFQLIKFHNFFSNKGQHLLFYAYYLESLYFEENSIYPKSDKNELIENIFLLYHKANMYDNKDFPYFRYEYLLSKLTTEQIKSFKEKKMEIPALLQKIFNDAFQKSYERLRASIKSKGSFIKQNSRFLRNTMDHNSKFLSLSSFDESIFCRNSPRFLINSKSTSSTPKLERNQESNKIIDLEKVSKQLKKEYRTLNTLRKEKKAPDQKKENDEGYLTFPKAHNSCKNSPSCTITDFTTFPEIRFGVESDFSSPILINKKKTKHQSLQPLDLIIEIANLIIQFTEKIKEQSIPLEKAATNETVRDDLEKIKILVEKLKIVNLNKCATTKQKYSFWLNCFNFLIIYALIYTSYSPKQFDDWRKMFRNCQFNIGGYEISLLEIEKGILNCYNYLNEEEQIGNEYCINKFGIIEDNILINFALSLPIQSSLFDIKIYKDDSFEEQLYQTGKNFLLKNIIIDKEKKIIQMTDYLGKIRPDIIGESLELYKNYFSEDTYKILAEINSSFKQEYEFKTLNISWELFQH